LGVFVGKPHLNGCASGVGGHAFAVATRIAVAQVDQRNQGARHREGLLDGAVFEFSDPKSVVDRNDTVHRCHSLATLVILRAGGSSSYAASLFNVPTTVRWGRSTCRLSTPPGIISNPNSPNLSTAVDTKRSPSRMR